ncbi:MAG: hypothetical protein AAGA01_12875, partial [Cyanobacteria bacterium P01_E01_bin.43]
MFALMRNLLLTCNDRLPQSVKSLASDRLGKRELGALTIFLAILSGAPANAQNTVLPDPALDLRFQTSGARRCANIGDWYTTLGAGNNATGSCGTALGGTADTVGAPGFHTFFISITEADLANGPI